MLRQHVEETAMGNCIVIVQFDLPKRTEEQAVKGGTASAPIYRNLAAKGLIRKDYLNGDAGTGGVYLWDSRASAEAWYTQARIAEFIVSAPPAAHVVRHARDGRQSCPRDARQRQGARRRGLSPGYSQAPSRELPPPQLRAATAATGSIA